MITASIELKKNDLPKIKSRLKTVDQISRRIGYRIIEVAAPLTPYKTGNLSQQISVIPDGRGCRVVWRMFYAIYQNFGTRYIPARSFAEQAAAIVFPEYVQQLKRLLT